MKLVTLALAWLGAMAFVALWGLPGWTLAACLLVTVPAALALRGRKWAFTVMLMAAFALVAGLRFDAWRHRDLGSLAQYVEQSVVLDGEVISEPDPGEFSAAYEIEAARISVSGRDVPVRGRLRVSLDQYAEYLPGTRLRLAGKLGDPRVFADFDYRAFLARRDVVATMSRPEVVVLDHGPRWSKERRAAQVRLALDHALQRALPEPEASLASGIAFGRDGNLPAAVYDDFRDAGLAHIVAVSGANVSLLTAIVFFLLTGVVGRKWALLPAGITVMLYLFAAGFSASVVRAGIMALVFLLGTYLGRQQSSLAALGAAAIAMTFWQPSAALDAGFQLSLAATAGLIVFGPWIRYALGRAVHRGYGRLVPEAVLQVVALSASATVATMPIIWVNFGRVSLVGPFANVVVEPLFVVAFALSGMTALAGAMSEPAGWAVGLVAYYPLAFITWFSSAMAGLPFAAVDVPGANGSVALAAYVALALLAWPAYRHYAPVLPMVFIARSERALARRVAWVAGSGVLVIAIVPLGLLPMGAPGRMEVSVLDVGDGDAVLVTTPSGKHVLIDGGPSGIVLARELGATLPHWERRLDALFLLRDHPEQAGGAQAVQDRFNVKHVFRGAGSGAEPSAAALVDGATLTVDDVVFTVLAPEVDGSSSAADGVALRIGYRGAAVLVSTLTAAQEQRLMAERPLQAHVLVVPHHGANKTDVAFLQAVHPSIAVVPAGTDRFAARPSEAVLSALAGALVLRTDRDGRVTLRTDGQRLSVGTAR